MQELTSNRGNEKPSNNIGFGVVMICDGRLIDETMMLNWNDATICLHRTVYVRQLSIIEFAVFDTKVVTYDDLNVSIATSIRFTRIVLVVAVFIAFVF